MTPGNVEGILGALGGVGLIVGAAWAILRSAFKMRMSTDANTDAVEKLTDKIGKLTTRVDQHDIDIGILKDRGYRR